MLDFGVAYDKLAGFENSGEIADFLKNQGVKGLKGHDEQCPIANWMNAQTGDAITVTGDYISKYFDYPADMPYEEYEIIMDEVTRIPTEAIMEFIARFDQGDFPELIEEPEYPEYMY